MENEVLCAVLHTVGLDGMEWDVGKETGFLRLAAKDEDHRDWENKYVNWKSICDPGHRTTDWLVYIQQTGWFT